MIKACQPRELGGLRFEARPEVGRSRSYEQQLVSPIAILTSQSSRELELIAISIRLERLVDISWSFDGLSPSRISKMQAPQSKIPVMVLTPVHVSSPSDNQHPTTSSSITIFFSSDIIITSSQTHFIRIMLYDVSRPIKRHRT
jgi:hypothetical protein